MNNKLEYNLQIHHPEECPKCKGHNLQPTSEFDGEYFRHWLRMVCRNCNYQWSEVYQLDS